MRKKAEGSATTAKEDANAFRQRWVNGAGMPVLRGAYAYDARASVLQIALRQSGSVQGLKAALKSKAKAEGLTVCVWGGEDAPPARAHPLLTWAGRGFAPSLGVRDLAPSANAKHS
jgi:hypothetical protein